MSDLENIKWFKNQFKTKMEDILRGMPFSLDMLTAIAMQETGYIWGPLREQMMVGEILKLCVGDTLDVPKRNKDAFPQNKADLLSVPNGDRMFRIAREALEAVAKYNAGYRRVAKAYPNKFCHGFGIFQYDLQEIVKVNRDCSST